MLRNRARDDRRVIFQDVGKAHILHGRSFYAAVAEVAALLKKSPSDLLAVL
jgi:hypothetical protein